MVALAEKELLLRRLAAAMIDVDGENLSTERAKAISQKGRRNYGHAAETQVRSRRRVEPRRADEHWSAVTGRRASKCCGPRELPREVGCCGNPRRLPEARWFANGETRTPHSTSDDEEATVQVQDRRHPRHPVRDKIIPREIPKGRSLIGHGLQHQTSWSERWTLDWEYSGGKIGTWTVGTREV